MKLFLETLRRNFGRSGSAVSLGILYFLSQAVIARILHPIGFGDFLRLQLSFSKEYYLATFSDWTSRGLMEAYQAHLFVDVIHPVWYALFLVSLLALALNRHRLSGRWNWTLTMPLVSALADEGENLIQILFLCGAAVTDLAVWISSLASLIKWTLAFVSLGLAIVAALLPKNESR